MVNAALSRASLGGANARAGALSPQVVRKLGMGADLIRLQSRLGDAELQKVLAELKADPTVVYAVADVRMQRADLRAKPTETKQLVPNDPYYAQYQWHFSNATGGINAPSAWDISQGEGVVVAVIDTGILPDHEDFSVRCRPRTRADAGSSPRLQRRANRSPGYRHAGRTDSTWNALHQENVMPQSRQRRNGT